MEAASHDSLPFHSKKKKSPIKENQKSVAQKIGQG